MVVILNAQRVPLLSEGAAARVAGVHRDTVHAAMVSGKLPFRRIDGVRHIDQRDLVAWAEAEGHSVVRVAA
jgi:hypothetical protein